MYNTSKVVHHRVVDSKAIMRMVAEPPKLSCPT
jgi:hypothetical protein